MARYRPADFRPAPAIEDDAAIERAIGKIATSISRPVGTAAMGQDARAVAGAGPARPWYR
jgi:choline dehydrogenase-like flavoprotein